VPRTPGIHEVDAFWRIALAHLAQPLTPPPDRLGLVLAPAHQAQAEAARRAGGVGAASAVVAPLAVGQVRGQAKTWPGFPLITRMLAESGLTVVACPGPGEDAAVRAAVPGAVILPGVGLGAYAAICAGAQVVVANDSGPMHLAAAVGAPVVGVFGVTDPARTQPWSRRGVAVGGARGWPGAALVWQAIERARS
jgi:heptosyltransferase II